MRNRSLAIVLLVGAVLASTFSSAYAADRPIKDDGPVAVPHEDKGVEQSEAEALRLDSESYADEFGVSVDEAIRRLDRMDSLIPVIAELRKNEADRLAGWGVSNRGDFGAWIYLTGDDDVDPASKRIIEREGDVTIQTGADFTYLALLDMRDKELPNIVPKDLIPLIVHTSIKMRDNGIEIGVAAESTDADLERLQAALVAGSKDGRGQSIYSVVRSSRLSLNQGTNMEGGQVIHAVANGTTYACTSGFGVQRHGTKGFLTAGHCRNSISGTALTKHWDGRRGNDLGNFWAPIGVMRNTVFGWEGDVMWYSLASNPPNIYNVTDDFWITKNHWRDVTGKVDRLDQMGHWVCSWGVSSGRSCGEVDDINFEPQPPCPWWNPWICDDVFVKASSDQIQSCTGDSGGPTFRVRKAYGTHVASDDGNCNNNQDYMVFMAIDAVEDALNVTLLTS